MMSIGSNKDQAMPAEPRSLKELFLAALAVAPSERPAWLEQACADAELRRHVELMLAAHDTPQSLLDHLAPGVARPESPPAGTVATVDEPIADGPGTLIGPYKLLEQIGEGGFGVVYMTEQQEPVRRKVALKILKPGMDTRQVIARFEAERQALAIMDHANIAKVYEGGATPSGRPYFVMELVKGVPITEFCDQNHLTPRQRLELFVPVCQAVQHAHQKGIIHRDLKPSNVLVTVHDTTPVVKVIDFGVAKALGQELTDKTLFTGFAQMVGTPLYMSPEQAGQSGLDVDTRSDIYALGVLLYELLTGTTPYDKERFRRAAFDEIRRIIREEEPVRPSTRISTLGKAAARVSANRQSDPKKLGQVVRGELDWIVMKCLEKDRNRRYETANAFATDLQRYLADQPVQAYPPSTGYRLHKFLRRNKGPVLAAGLLLLALLAGLIGTSVGLVRESRARALAEGKEQEAQAAAAAEALAKRQAEADAHRAANAERQAKEEAAVAQAVRSFLQADLLSQADPLAQAETLRQGGGGFATRENPSIKELLDRVAGELTPITIEAKFPKLPLVQAEILRTVGQTYRGIGEYSKAVAHLHRAADLYRKTLGPDNPETLATMHQLAIACLGNGKVTDSIALLETVRGKQATQLGHEHSATLTTRTDLALAYLYGDRMSDSFDALEEVRKIATKRFGPNDLHTLRAVLYMAIGHITAGRPADAIPLLETVRDTALTNLAPDHPYALYTLYSLAQAYRTAGRPAEAVPLLETVRKAQVAKLGPNHPNTISTLVALSGACQAAGKSAQYLASLGELHHAKEAAFGLDHRDTLAVLHELATAHRLSGKTEQALPLYQQAAERARHRWGLADPSTRIYLRSLGDCYERLNQFAKAEPLQQELAAFLRAKADADPREYARDLSNLGLTLLRQKRFTDAERTLRECLAIREKHLPDLWVRFNTLSQLGGSLLGQKKYAEAEPLLLAGYEGMKGREELIWAHDRVRLCEAVDRLVELYAALGNQDEAAKWRAERKKRSGDPTHGSGPSGPRGVPEPSK
jgi:serine/threonine protein kinase